MAYTTRIDHEQRLVVFRHHGEITEADLLELLQLMRHQHFPYTYDLLTLFDPEGAADIDSAVLVSHALERRRVLAERDPGRVIRSAVVNVPEGIRTSMNIWRSFFPPEEDAVKIAMFEDVPAALDWLGRKPFDEARMELFPG